MKNTALSSFRILQLFWKANGYITAILFISILYENTFYPLIQVLLLARILDIFSKGGTVTFGTLAPFIAMYITSTIIRLCLTTFTDSKLEYYKAKLESYLDYITIEKLTTLDPATFEKASFQDLLAQTEGVKGSMTAGIERVVGLMNATTQALTAAVVVSVVSPLFAPLLILASIPLFYLFHKYREATWVYFVEKRSLMTRITQYVKGLLSLDATSKETTIYQTGKTLITKVKTHQLKYYKDFSAAINPYVGTVMAARIFQFVAFLFIQYQVLLNVMRGIMSIGQFTLFFQQSIALASGIEGALNMYSSLQARTKYIERFFEFLDTKPVIKTVKNGVPLPDAPKPPVIEFKNVTFRYPKQERDILRKFNLTIQSGEKVALVGENGAGKSTLIKLLLRFYDVSEGEILVNGINIKELNLAEWHTMIGALFQDFIKYNFTFKENVYFGDLTKENDKPVLEQAIQQSGASTYLETLPKGIDQVVGKMFDGGIDLSGGQWQKLALARAFYRDAPILILDEPTSAIDAKAEYEIFERVQNLQKDKTVIIISHRFSTVRNADRILVLNDGRIIEEGNHNKLMNEKGLYAELFELQAQGYK